MEPGADATYWDLKWIDRQFVHQLVESLPDLVSLGDELLHQPEFPTLTQPMRHA